MGILFSGLWQDPSGTLAGFLRRLIGRGDGQPRSNDTGSRLSELSRSVRYIPVQLDDLVRGYPGYPQPMFERAMVDEEDGKWEAVLETGKILVSRHGAHLFSYDLALRALRHLRRFDEAEAMAIAAIRRFPTGVGAWRHYAGLMQDKGDMVTAEQRWRMVVRRFPKEMWPRLMVATSRAANGDREEADRQLSLLFDDYPEEFWVLFHYADMAERRGDFAVAATRWEAGLRVFPGRPDIHVRLVKALLNAGDLAGAVARLDGAAFIFPRDPALLAAREAVTAAGGKPAPLPSR